MGERGLECLCVGLCALAGVWGVFVGGCDCVCANIKQQPAAKKTKMAKKDDSAEVVEVC